MKETEMSTKFTLIIAIQSAILAVMITYGVMTISARGKIKEAKQRGWGDGVSFTCYYLNHNGTSREYSDVIKDWWAYRCNEIKAVQ